MKTITQKNISIIQSGSVKKSGNIGIGQNISSFSTNNANSSNLFIDNRVDVDFANMISNNLICLADFII